MTCSICDHNKRHEIESLIMCISRDNPSVTIKTISQEFGVKEADLKRHALLHTPLGVDEGTMTYEPPAEDVEVLETAEPKNSLVRMIKLREADQLQQVANEYMITLKNLGRRINRSIADEESSFERLLTKPVADMYIGLGGEIRATAKALADMNNLLNGPEQDSSSGLKALAEAIRGSIPGDG